MKRLMVVMLFAAVLAGCSFHIAGLGSHIKAVRTLQLSAAMPAGRTFQAATHNGHIFVAGAETAECKLTATITGRAVSEEGARKIAQETEVELDSAAGALVVRIRKPNLSGNESVCVDLDVTLPVDCQLELSSYNGAIKAENITGRIAATTHNGGISCAEVSGPISARTYNGAVEVACAQTSQSSPEINATTHNGGITCRDVAGKVRLETYNGRITASYSETADPAIDADLVTHNGSVKFAAPPGLNAKVFVSTHNGAIATEIPVAVRGKIAKSIDGTAGEGKGNLVIRTYNGSVDLR